MMLHRVRAQRIDARGRVEGKVQLFLLSAKPNQMAITRVVALVVSPTHAGLDPYRSNPITKLFAQDVFFTYHWRLAGVLILCSLLV